MQQGHSGTLKESGNPTTCAYSCGTIIADSAKLGALNIETLRLSLHEGLYRNLPFLAAIIIPHVPLVHASLTDEHMHAAIND